jgi:hypothetical protein
MTSFSTAELFAVKVVPRISWIVLVAELEGRSVSDLTSATAIPSPKERDHVIAVFASIGVEI